MKLFSNKIILIVLILLIPITIIVLFSNAHNVVVEFKKDNRYEVCIGAVVPLTNNNLNDVQQTLSPTETFVLNNGEPIEKQITKPNTIYIIKHNYKLSSDITLPDNCILRFEGGCITGNHMLIGSYTGIEAESRIIIEPSVTISGTWLTNVAYPVWFGAIGDGKSDDTRALQNLFNLRTNCKFEKGKTYCLRSVLSEESRHYKSTCLTLHSNTTIDGNSSTIRLGDGFLKDNNSSVIIADDNAEEIIIRNLTIDGNSSKNLFKVNGNYKYRCYFLMFCGGRNILIENCNFYNCPGRNMISLCSKLRTEPSPNPFAQVFENAIVRNCKFKTGGAYISGSKFNTNQDDFSFIYSEFSDFYCYNNEIINLDLDTKGNVRGTPYETRKTFLSGKIPDSKTKYWSGGIEIHGNRCVVYNNKIVGCRPAIYIGSINSSFRQDNVWVYNNDCIDCAGGIELYGNDGQYGDIKITNNNLKLIYDGVAIGFVRSGKDFYSHLEISNNTVYRELFMESKSLTGINIPTGKNIIIKNNTLTNMNVGISFYKGIFHDVTISKNQIFSSEKGISLNMGREYRNLQIESNQFRREGKEKLDGLNIIQKKKKQDGGMIAFYGLASPSGIWKNVVVRENYVDESFSLTENPKLDISKLNSLGIIFEASKNRK